MFASFRNDRNHAVRPCSMPELNDEIFAQLRASLEFLTEVENAASYCLPVEVDSVFRRIGIGFTACENNESLCPKTRDSCSKLEKYTEELRQCLSAIYYHISNVRTLENSLSEIIQRYHAVTPHAQGGHYNPTVTNRFTFEYHAFVFASVRCVNHVFPVIGQVCFGKKCPNKKSFRKISEGKSSLLLTDVNHILERNSELDKLFKQKNQKSIRDWIAHEQFLFSGSLHIEEQQATLIGILPLEIANIDLTMKPHTYLLSLVMENQAEKIKRFVLAALNAVELFYFNEKMEVAHG